MYATHPLIVVDPYAKYGMPMSNQKIVIYRTQKHVKKPVNLTLRSKVNVVLGSGMYATHRRAGQKFPHRDGQTDRQTIPIYPPPRTSIDLKDWYIQKRVEKDLDHGLV